MAEKKEVPAAEKAGTRAKKPDKPEKKKHSSKKAGAAAETISAGSGTKQKKRMLPSLQKRPRGDFEPRGVPASPNMPVLQFVIFIIEWKASRYITEVFEENNVRFHFICKGRGTASSEVLDLLGIGVSEKAVVFCLEQDVMAPLLIKEVSRSLGLYNPGAGIAFTVPLSGVNKPILQVFKDSIHKHISERKKKLEKTEDKMSAEKKFDLIMIIVNQGYSDELMTTARDAGATGGTILNARGLVHRGPVKFFGISVQDEREIIIILANRDKKIAIMQAVSESFGINSKAKGLVFSLPAENVTGLNQM
ncbi:MAG: hypothetical protein LBD31_09440 [Treponema sp.]|jgi:hypothetical protein|nr:hypothetical protein [Treponema sp.]